MLRPRPAGRRQRGLSVVELMVGVAIGLIVVAGATLVMSTQLVENRRMLMELQLQQDLRATGDIVARELRRSGGMREDLVMATVWPSVATEVQTNPRATELTLPSSAEVGGSYHVDENPNYWAVPGFELRSDGVIYTRVGVQVSNTWQALTDARAMNVTAFRVTLTSSTAVKLPCLNPCPDGTADCWPSYQVREFRYEIEAQARSDATVKRALSGRSRVRNDVVNFYDAASNLLCPA